MTRHGANEGSTQKGLDRVARKCIVLVAALLLLKVLLCPYWRLPGAEGYVQAWLWAAPRSVDQAAHSLNNYHNWGHFAGVLLGLGFSWWFLGCGRDGRRRDAVRTSPTN